MKKLSFIALVLLCTLPLFAQTVKNIPERKPVLSNEKILANIDSYVNQVMSEWKIPGAGLSLYKDGQLLMSKGYGVKDYDHNVPVDEHTVFQIGSVSKSFTATVVAQLVDEGLLSWEDKVKDILPDFEMYDPWVTANIQVKDLTSHRSGMRDDIGTYLGNLGYNRDDIYKMFKYMPPAYTFRGDYQYNNITFIPLAKIVEKLTGKSWEENVRERILEPLGMKESTLNGEGFAEAMAQNRAALPYAFERKGKEMSVFPMYGDEQSLWWLTVIGPAGSLCCTPDDFTKYAQFHLNNGKVGDKQLVSEKQMKYLHTGVTITSQSPDKTCLYGHCWFIEQTRKCRMYFHTGTTWGMTAICVFIPELDMAMTIQFNSEVPAEPRYAIVRRTIDLFLGYEDYDYSKEYLALWYSKAEKRAEADAKAEAEKVAVAPHETSLLVGTYAKSLPFGDIDITVEDGKPYIKMHNEKAWKRELKHINGDKYNFRADGWGFDVKFSFSDKSKKAESLELTIGSGEDFGPWVRK